ncbi:4Fe-4S dicluster domain-containing protein [Dictyoglomus thermophilum]|uniref:2Fe-2S iron-sulfur cluster-binding protein n=1 Tax=Dictyoglomus thermophilum TaxID=14 RepID=UPI0011EB90E5|nr:2Fe-2S iron-sulfur cluster-binding protein [Dictyoglomus thermophilum]TYT24212.1 4Fe-4S dicluster domain-containing protein [Dictyoglomus thermophilum]
MENIKIKVNGNEVEVSPGKTVLQVLKDLGIHVPVLCHYEPLMPQGSCRLCVVEDRGVLKTACTTPVEPNMDIKTDTPNVINSRKLVLQLLFSERNHYCMYCEVTGECELQDLGYEFGLDHFEFPTYERRFPVDNTHDFIMMDHNRCVLCRRCVRVCSEVAGHFVLGEMERGIDTMIIADMDVPLGNSSCVSCGLCAQVCPTGAIIDKRSSYLGREVQSEIIYSNCDMCPVGCGMEIYKKQGANFIVKIYGDWNSDVSHGLLCKVGRYLSLYDEKDRVVGIKLKDDFGYRRLHEDNLIEIFKNKLNNAVAYVDGSLFNEEIEMIKEVFKDKVYSLYPNNSPIPTNINLSELDNKEFYVVINADLNREYGAVGSIVKRNVIGKKAKLMVIDKEFNSLAKIADYVFNIKDLNLAMDILKKQKEVVVIYKDITEEEKNLLSSLNNAKFLHLPKETNSIGLQKYDIKHEKVEAENVFVFGKNLEGIKDLPLQNSFVVVFTPYEDEVLRRADLIVGTTNGFEREGTFYNLEGNILKKERVLKPDFDVLDLKSFLSNVLGKTEKVY